MEEYNETEAAKNIRERTRKRIHLPKLNEDIIIRRLSPLDFLFSGEEIPAEFIKQGEEEMARRVLYRLRHNRDEFKEHINRLIIEGIVSPRVVSNNDEPEDGELQVSDLAPDSSFILNELYVFSGLGETANEFFRADEKKEEVAESD